MTIHAVGRVLVLLLVLVPLVSAAVVSVSGCVARRVALLAALFNLGLAAAVVGVAIPALGYRTETSAYQRGDSVLQRFQPEYVPGDTASRSDGADGRTEWTLLHLSSAPNAPGRFAPDVQLFLGIDGLNLWLVALAAVMLPPAVLISWESVTDRPGAFYGWLFLLQAGLVGAFLSFDVMLFYVFFELTLIPAFFLIGRWGVGSGRRDAARKFFLYTLAGSLLTLLGVVGVVLTNPTPVDALGRRVSEAVIQSGPPNQPATDWVMAKRGPLTFSLPDLMGNVQVWAAAEATANVRLAEVEQFVTTERARPGATAEQVRAAERTLDSARRVQAEAQQVRAKHLAAQFWLFIALMAGFMVKVPIWPFHTWLPAAYGEAPTGVVVLLSAVMAKLGTFGILRLVLPLVPDAALAYGLPAIGSLAAFGIVYAALCAYASKDMKMVIAYSSVSHLGFLVLALFAFNKEGLTGATLHMVNHGLSTGALFAVLGFLTDRYRTTEMAKFGGLMGRFPRFAVLTFVLCLASVGLPGLNNFVSEMLMLGGLFDARNPGAGRLGLAVVAAVGIFLSAWYTLTMLQRVFFNPVKEPEPVAPDAPARDVSRREFFAFGSLAGLCLLLGLVPQPVINTLAADVRVLSNIGDAARARAAGVRYVSDEPLVVPSAPAVLTKQAAPKGGGQKGGGGGKGGGGKGGGQKGGPPALPPAGPKGPPPGEE
ncbi:complex I subunit 4 family protein [Frigoriglobus tundricola]|uniref:NADH-ubiquinone oxidoreductase chain M n=1 Tax=Frigoriglobus tundricola TaxID=2774151 RepID=A0A6M5YKU7_9BACT|nr:NADH-quinone oxidoreductase subunit M [Frigoriglobus tundricola]QJW93970.1 NADH-ubiquinone oxidoreductase chain M [Frigoriglobus tundricola]